MEQFHIKMMRNEMWFYINLAEVRNIGNIQYLNVKVVSVKMEISNASLVWLYKQA